MQKVVRGGVCGVDGDGFLKFGDGGSGFVFVDVDGAERVVEGEAVGVLGEGFLEIGFGEGEVVGFGGEVAEALEEAGAVEAGGVLGGETLVVSVSGALGLVGDDVGVGEVDVGDGAVGLELDDGLEVLDGVGEFVGIGDGVGAVLGEVEVAEVGVGEP